MVLEERKVSP